MKALAWVVEKHCDMKCSTAGWHHIVYLVYVCFVWTMGKCPLNTQYPTINVIGDEQEAGVMFADHWIHHSRVLLRYSHALKIVGMSIPSHYMEDLMLKFWEVYCGVFHLKRKTHPSEPPLEIFPSTKWSLWWIWWDVKPSKTLGVVDWKPGHLLRNRKVENWGFPKKSGGISQLNRKHFPQ